MVPCLHQDNEYIKRKLRVSRAQKCNLLVGAKTVPPGTGPQITPFNTAPYWAVNGNLRDLDLPIAMVPCLNQDNDYIKRKLRVCRAQKCNLLVGANTVPPGTGLHSIRFLTAQCMVDNGNLRDLDLPIAMVPCLHQDNDYIKRKLRVCRAQKCNLLVGAKTVPPGTGPQITPFNTATYWAVNGNLRDLDLPIAMVPCLHQDNDYIKRKLRVCRAQKCNLLVGAKTVPPGTGLQTIRFLTAQCMADNGNLRDLDLPIAMAPCLHQDNDYIKRKLRVCRAQKCNLLVGAKTVPPGTGLHSIPFLTAQCMVDNGNLRDLDLPIAMVPCLHQDNDYIKRKLRVCRAQKCNLLVGAKTVPPGTGLQTIRFLTAQCMADNGNLRDLDLPIAMAPCLHQDNDYIKRKLRVCRAQKCNLLVGAKTVPPGTGLHSIPFLTAQCMVDNGNLRDLDLPIAMVPCLHQDNDYIKRKLRVCRAQKCNLLVGAKTVPPGMGLQTIRFLTAQCMADNGNLRDLDLPINMVPCLHQDNDYFKRKLRVCRAQKCNLLVGEKTVPPGVGLQTIRFLTAQCMADNGNLRDLDLPIAMVPCLHQDNYYIKRKLRVCRAQKCNLLVGAKTVPSGTGLQTIRFLTAQCMADNGNLRDLDLPIAMVPCLH